MKLHQIITDFKEDNKVMKRFIYRVFNRTRSLKSSQKDNLFTKKIKTHFL